MNSELFGKIIERAKAVAGIDTFLILPVATLYLAVLAWHAGTYDVNPPTQPHRHGTEPQ